jgi:hypothetical protein
LHLGIPVQQKVQNKTGKPENTTAPGQANRRCQNEQRSMSMQGLKLKHKKKDHPITRLGLATRHPSTIIFILSTIARHELYLLRN